ncbi:MAG: glycosyltransferase family 2 protein [Clostridiales bacterium]|nr:glycosyltransferase family 2 protein [Clostridiales bacterium]
MDIAIVIPVYNCEKYLRKCLDSVCAQNDCVKEIILVNDGSTDSSLDICGEYAQKDSRIKIIDKVNEGTEQAIVDGVNASKCEYIGFTDSDDNIEPDMFSSLAQAIEEHNADIAFCDYDDEDESGSRSHRRNFGVGAPGLYTKTNGKFDFSILPTLADSKYVAAMRWNKLYRREKLVGLPSFKNNGIRMGEDMALIVPAIMASERIVYVDKCLYHYVQRGDSIVHTYTRQNLDDWKNNIKIFAHAAEKYDYRGVNIEESAVGLLIQNCLKSIRRSGFSFTERKKEYAFIGNDSDVRALLKKVNLANAPGKKRLLLKLLKNKMFGLLAMVYK